MATEVVQKRFHWASSNLSLVKWYTLDVQVRGLGLRYSKTHSSRHCKQKQHKPKKEWWGIKVSFCKSSKACFTVPALKWWFLGKESLLGAFVYLTSLCPDTKEGQMSSYRLCQKTGTSGLLRVGVTTKPQSPLCSSTWKTTIQSPVCPLVHTAATMLALLFISFVPK